MQSFDRYIIRWSNHETVVRFCTMCKEYQMTRYKGFSTGNDPEAGLEQDGGREGDQISPGDATPYDR